MQKIALFILLISTIYANTISHLATKGKNAANIFCDAKKLPSSAKDLKDAILKIKSNKACEGLDDKKLEWVGYYILSKKSAKSNLEKIDVPNGAKCPVCGMFVYKYPKWAAKMVIDGKKLYFDGVKDMMKYYFFDGDFKYDRAKIELMEVTNYYTLKPIKAKDAIYVYDSKVFGPMGREFIPFSTLKEAKSFIANHAGKIMKFNQITPKNTMALDGVDFEAK